ncbi:MAG: RNB domain-containing ribonuclease [Synechococcaceae cyanobacterium]|nr:RNB domain-containing ribonuclease [Synechococcaceae cyanobacterium]
MKFTVADLLDQLSNEESRPQEGLEKALGLSSPEERDQFRIGLEALIRLQLVEQNEAGLRRLDSPELIPARLRCSSKGFCFALREDGGEDIYIREHQLNHAWNGDRVLVRITREGGRRRSPEGGVQCILERSTTSLLAQVEQQEERLVAVPLDDRLLTSVELPAADAAYLAPPTESVVEVRVDRFPVAQFAPQGHVARSLPVHGGDAADLDLLLTKHRLHERPAAPRATVRTPHPTRQDLTALPTLLLSPWSTAEAPPLPALSLEALEEGGWRLWLHAPAVSERIGFGQALEAWIQDQGEAFCLGSRWLPLLPSALAKAAAFRVGSREAAVSVALELDGEGALQHFRFCLSEILPAASLQAEALTALAERKPRSRTLPAALKPLKDHLPLVEQLLELTARLRERRLAAGSLDLDLPIPALDSLADLRVPNPDDGSRGWLVQLPATEPAALLREAVLLAHRAAGNHLAALQLPAIYAVNPLPEAGAIKEVAKAALALEIPLELGAEGNASAADLAAAFARTDRARALQQLLQDGLNPVQLSEEAGPHAVSGETVAFAPWSLPGLHAADLWNQHLLVTLLIDGKDRPTVRHKTCVDLASDSCHGAIDWPLFTPSQTTALEEPLRRSLVQKLNGRRRFQQELQDDTVAMAQARHAEPLVNQVVRGVISGIQSYGFFVEVPPSQVEGLVHVSSLKDDWYEYRSRQNRLVGRKYRRNYMLGDSVDVEIQKVDALRHQIDLAVIQPEISAEEADAASGRREEADHPGATEDRDGREDFTAADAAADGDGPGDDDGGDAAG